MKKTYCILVLGVIAASVFSASYGGEAATSKCVVIESRGSKIVLDCSFRQGTFKKGTLIKMKSAGKSARNPRPDAGSPLETGNVVKGQ